MKWLDFFIERPVSASVINIMLVICGVLAFKTLVVDEYPQIVVPKLKVVVYYPNASPETVEKEITMRLEESLALVEGLESMSSSSKNSQGYVRLHFLPGVSMDRAVMQVNEQLSRIAPRLPKDALAPMIKRGDDEGDAILWLAIKSETMSGAELTHFTHTKIKSYFQGIDGLAEAMVLGPSYAMSITFDPLALYNQKISLDEIQAVLKKNELELQAGVTRSNEPISLEVVAKNPRDYSQMIVGANHGVPVTLGQVADIELVQDEKDSKVRLNGQSVVFIGLTKASDGNILGVTEAVKKIVPKVNQEIRGQAEINVETDKSIFVRESLKTIYRTVAEACVLVLLIIFLFLRHLRATLVPMVTIPISLVATFFSIKFFGLSINTITLLAMVLAVGLVVDDAIVVLENIFRFREQGLSSKEAAKKGAREIGFAIVAMTCTLISVFLPLVFVSDLTGVILREFAITLASAVFFSGIVALTLSPLMCAHLLKHESSEGKISRGIERGIQSIEKLYEKLLHKSFHYKKTVFLVLLIILGIGGFGYTKLSSDLLPKEDRGIIGAFIPTVPGFTIEQMEPYVSQVEEILLAQEGVENSLTIINNDSIVIVSLLKHWNQRKVHAEKLVANVREKISGIPTANIYPWSWNVGLQALDDSSHQNAAIAVALKSAKSYEEIDQAAQKFVDALRKDGVLKDVRKDFNRDEKAYRVKLLREPLAALGISEQTISLSLQANSDRMHAAKYRLEGQAYNVFLQPNDASKSFETIYLKTKETDFVPMTTVASIEEEVVAPNLRRLNQMRVINVLANLPPNKSLSEAKEYLQGVIKAQIPSDISVGFEGSMAVQEKSNNTFILLFLAGLIFIFAVLAIQFEGIIDPLIILFTVPLACIGAVIMLWMTGNGTNLYTHVGMLTLVGLITKHGILLTEFVGQNLRVGKDLKESVFMAAKLRFRPIVMTTAATVLGALPLITTSGAGVEARASIGLVIVGGLIFGTILTLFVLPSIIYVVHSNKNKFLKTSA